MMTIQQRLDDCGKGYKTEANAQRKLDNTLDGVNVPAGFTIKTIVRESDGRFFPLAIWDRDANDDAFCFAMGLANHGIFTIQSDMIA